MVEPVLHPPQKSAAREPEGPVTPLHQPLLHESGLRHTSGEAKYVDDFPAPAGMLVAQIVASTQARARIRKIDTSKAKQVPGVHAVITARDIAGENNVGPVVHDEELLASQDVHFLGQALALVVGETYEACRAGVAAVVVELEPLLSEEMRMALGDASEIYLVRPRNEGCATGISLT